MCILGLLYGKKNDAWLQSSTGWSRVHLSPETAASVMARPGTLCIATVTVLVILAAAIQPGEHCLTTRICTCTMGFVLGKKCSHTKWSSFLLQNLFLHVLHDFFFLFCQIFFFYFFVFTRTIAAMLAACMDNPLLCVMSAMGYAPR